MTSTKVIWFDVNLDKWEYDWISELLEDIETEIIVTNTFENLPPLENCVVVCNHAVNYRAYLDALRRNGNQYGVILLSDENVMEPMEYVHDPNCKFVARNYFHPFYHLHPKVFVFGLGYKTGFTKVDDEFKTFKDRELDWCFAGSVHNDKRKEAIEKFKNYSGDYKLHTCSGFNATDGLSTEEYRKLLNNCKFALCPQGQENMDSFRIYEALEAGAVPVTIKHSQHMIIEPSYWHAIFYGDLNLPFVIGADWDDAVNQLKNLKIQDCEKMQSNCQAFWSRWKTTWKTKFSKNIKLLRR